MFGTKRKGGSYFVGSRRKESRYFVGEKNLSYRSDDLFLVADFRPTDRVLDMGCAEGLISLNVAEKVAHVQGVEIDAKRVELAKATATKRGVANASFEVGSAVSYPLNEPYDVVLFLSVLGKPGVGLEILTRYLDTARRQLYCRVGINQKHADRGIDLERILQMMDRAGFDGVCLPRPEPRNHLVIANRRGTDAKLRKVPPFVLMPAQRLADDPCLRSVPIGGYREFKL